MFNTQTSHPLIPNSQQYQFEQQYISIHSEDRNIIKYPNSSEFEIELPQNYNNVQGFRLASGCFPANFHMFSPKSKNITLTFEITIPYNAAVHTPGNNIQTKIQTMLTSKIGTNFIVNIETGTYTAQQMVTEIQNKMNYAVFSYLIGSSTIFTVAEIDAYKLSGGYKEFIIAYHEVDRKLRFGNRSSQFKLTNTDTAKFEEQGFMCLCDDRNISPDFKHWGLPGYLGFTRCDITASEQTSLDQNRFYYGDVVSGDNGFWLTPNPVLANSTAYFIIAPLSLNIRPPSYFYMDISLLNSIDETAPYNFSKFTQETNQTNGKVKSSFAKIPLIFNDNENNYYEDKKEANFYKIFTPPVERIRKLNIRLRYHNGMLVDFNNSDFTFVLEFGIMRPQNNLGYNIRVPEVIGNNP